MTEASDDLAAAPTGPGGTVAAAGGLAGVTVGGKFVLREVLSVGGMGSVYRADQLALGRTVAVKVLKAELARDQEMVRRFHAEARAASRLNHPNTISIIDFGQTPDGLLYLVMELVRGATLREVLHREFPLPRARLLDVMGQLLDGLQEAHAHGVVHRDIKPDNVMIERLASGRDLVKIADFGIARLGEEAPVRNAQGEELISGTPEYMAPEQVLGEKVDGRADLYATGVMLYELLTHERPFGGDEIEIMEAHLHVPPPAPSARHPELDISPALETVVLRALAKDPAGRFATAAEFRAALEATVATSAAAPRCPQCGAAAPAGSQFCPACGGRLSPSPDRAPELAAAAAAPVPGPSPARRWRFPLPLVGRERELARVDALLAGREGARALVLLGPAGIGKTELCRHAATRAVAGGYRVVTVGADPHGLAPSWRPVRLAVRALLDLPAAPDDAALAAALAAAGVEDHHAPGLAELLGLGGPAAPLELAVRRRESAAAALRVLRGTTGAGPTLLIFEDVERYDRPSLELVQRLLEFPGAAPTHLLVTAGPGSDLEAVEGPEVLALEPLSDEAVGATLDAVGAVGVEASEVANATGGVPLHVEQLLRLRSEGRTGGRGAALADVIDARIEALPAAARWALQAAAVHGMATPRRLVEALVREAEGLAPALAMLVDRGLLETDGETLRFRHPLVQEVAASGVPADARRELHAQLHALLAAAGAEPALVGHHGDAAGEGASVVAPLERAGLEAQRCHDDAGAVVHFRKAWEAARRAFLGGDEGAETELGRVGVRLGGALRYSGHLTAADGVLTEALGYLGEAPHQAACALRALAQVAVVGDQPERGREHLRAALAQAMRTGDHELLAETYLDFCTLLERTGEVAAAVAEAGEGVLLVTAGGGAHSTDGPPLTWRLVMRLAELHLLLGEGGEALDHAAAALMQAERAGSPVGVARTNALLGTILAADGRGEEARRYRERAAALLRGLGDRRSTAELLLDLAAAERSTGATASVRAHLLEALELAQAVEWRDGAARAAAALAALPAG